MVHVDEVVQRSTARRHHRPEGDACDSAGCDPQALTQREDGVEHCADGVRQGSANCRSGSGGLSAAEEPRAVGLVLLRAQHLALDDGEMGGPDRGLGRRPGAAGGDQRAVLRQILGLDEEL